MKPNNQTDMKSNKKDRISGYLSMLNMGMLFDELSISYLEGAGVLDILRGVPVPVSVDEDGNMTTLTIALNMARVIGGDNNYPYAQQYMKYIDRITNGNAAKVLIAEGAKSADNSYFEDACMFFRAALLFDPKSRDALYLYGRACKEAYESEEHDEKYVGNFKAESLEAFELLTILHPEYYMGYYFLGYAYLNLGLYAKAKITFEEFMDYSEDVVDESRDSQEERLELRKEVQERLYALDEPVVIEKGVNQILSGDFQGGKDTLSAYKEGRYKNWWPMWYYLGVAEASLGNAEEAAADYKHALTLSPSNVDVMKELVQIYEAIGDETNAEKYRKKIDIVAINVEAEANE